jgi:hypothetical protein
MQLARIADRHRQDSSHRGVTRFDGVVVDLNVARLLPRKFAQHHLDFHFFPASLHTIDEAVLEFEGFHPGQKCGNGVDRGAIERKQNVPDCESGSCGRAVRENSANSDVVVRRRLGSHSKIWAPRQFVRSSRRNEKRERSCLKSMVLPTQIRGHRVKRTRTVLHPKAALLGYWA